MQIFIGYAKEDRFAAQRLASDLERRGFSVWIDTKSLSPGQRWRAAIEDAIRNSDLFLAVLSPRSLNKRGFVQREIRIALDVVAEVPPDQVYFIPLRLEPCDPKDPRLRELQWLDLFPSYQKAIDQLVDVLRGKAYREYLRPAGRAYAELDEQQSAFGFALLNNLAYYLALADSRKQGQARDLHLAAQPIEGLAPLFAAARTEIEMATRFSPEKGFKNTSALDRLMQATWGRAIKRGIRIRRVIVAHKSVGNDPTLSAQLKTWLEMGLSCHLVAEGSPRFDHLRDFALFDNQVLAMVEDRADPGRPSLLVTRDPATVAQYREYFMELVLWAVRVT